MSITNMKSKAAANKELSYKPRKDVIIFLFKLPLFCAGSSKRKIIAGIVVN